MFENNEANKNFQVLGFGRIARSLILIGFVTFVFVVVSAHRLDGRLFSIALVVIGTVTFISSITALIGGMSRYLEETA